MLSAQNLRDGDGSTFVITPNNSLSWYGNKVFFGGMCLLSFTIAGVFAVYGMWLVLPFAGFEMLVLGLGLYACALRATRYEVVRIERDAVEVSVGRRRPEQSCAFKRPWAQVILQPGPNRNNPERLLIRAHGREVEVGACLNNEEREQLARALRRAI